MVNMNRTYTNLITTYAHIDLYLKYAQYATNDHKFYKIQIKPLLLICLHGYQSVLCNLNNSVLRIYVL